MHPTGVRTFKPASAARPGRTAAASQAARSAPVAASSRARAGCACGGACPRCAARPALWTGLHIGLADDHAERQAEQFAGADPHAAGHEAAARPLLQPGPASTPLARHFADGPGRAIDPALRRDYEPALGIDLSAVRLHTGDRAARSASQFGARAFTLGADVFFAAGQYRPASPRGRRLLAHELAHVAQAASRLDGQVPTLRRAPDGDAATQPGLDPLPLWCGGGIDDWARWFLLIEPTVWSDLLTCACFGTALIDVVSPDPVFETLDCLCGLMTFAQTVYALGADGGCWSWSKVNALDAGRAGALLGAVAADCASAPVGLLIGAALGVGGGGTGGSVAGPPGAAGGAVAGGLGGAALGAVLGSAIVDIASMVAQNLAQQGTALPQAQLTACDRTWQRLALQLSPPAGG